MLTVDAVNEPVSEGDGLRKTQRAAVSSLRRGIGHMDSPTTGIGCSQTQHALPLTAPLITASTYDRQCGIIIAFNPDDLHMTADTIASR